MVLKWGTVRRMMLIWIILGVVTLAKWGFRVPTRAPKLGAKGVLRHQA